MDEHEVEVEVQVKDIALDPSLNVPVVMLAAKDGGAVLPIWIGAFEANAIALFFEGSQPARPMTHDLFISSLEALGAKIVRLVVSDLVDSTFVSLLHITQQGRLSTIDSRPSDGIALALRAGAPIFVRRRVFEKASLQKEVAAGVEPEGADEEEVTESVPEKTEWQM
jgi:bifunctional DNase/RNase